MNIMSYFYHQGGGLGCVAEVRNYLEEEMCLIIIMNRSEYDALLMLNVLDSELVSYSKNNKKMTS